MDPPCRHGGEKSYVYYCVWKRLLIHNCILCGALHFSLNTAWPRSAPVQNSGDNSHLMHTIYGVLKLDVYSTLQMALIGIAARLQALSR